MSLHAIIVNSVEAHGRASKELIIDIKNMKKTLLLTLAILLSVNVFSQSRSVLLRETFDAMSAPEGWNTSDNSNDNWSISMTNKSGGEANELKFSSEPKTTGISRMITKPVNLTGLSSVSVSFRHFFDKKSMSAKIGIATSSNNGQNWNEAWSETYSEGGQYTVIKSIKTPDMGKDNVLFCVYYQGNSTLINGWYFDDFEVSSLESIDAKAESIDINDIIPAGENDIIFSVQNAGLDAITSFEAKFEMNGEIITESFETELAQYETKQFSFEQKIMLTPDNYNCSIEITSVNGQDDQNKINNIARKNVKVALNQTQRLAMIEHFSSSTCANCVILDGKMKELSANNPGKYTYTKYVMNWPSPGDPYYKAEANVKKSMYNVNSVPFLAVNGKSYGYSGITEDEFKSAFSSPAFICIKGAFNLENNTINVKADIMSYVDLSNVTVNISVNEKMTTGNVGSNGLKEFHHIMMKMLPDSKGSTVDFKAGEYQHFEFSHDMSKTFVEELNDLEVAVWIQDNDTKEIYNSNYLYEYEEHPYPVQNLTLTNSDNLMISWEAPENNKPIGYNVFVNNELVSESTTELSYTVENPDGFYGVEVVALYENDITSVGVADVIIIGCHAPVNIKYDLETFAEDFEFKHKVTLTWDAVDEADFYTVYVNGEKVGDAEETMFVTGFDVSGIYNYTITSNCDGVESEHPERCTVFLEIAGIEDEKENKFIIYPNPVNDELHIATEANIEEISIYDIYGRLCCRDASNASTSTIDTFNVSVQDLENGIYFINIKTDKGNIVKRFIKN